MRETKWWAWHMIAGVVILVLLGLHMLITHFDGLLRLFNPAGPSAIAWENVVARAQDVGHAVVYIVLLGAALFHGLYGFRTILFELSLSRGARKFVNVLFWLFGIGMFVFGAWAAIAASSLEITV